MQKSYRALISVPIAAEDDDEAFDRAAAYARSLRHPGSSAIAGHVELVIEAYTNSLKAKRVVDEDPGLWAQLGRSREFRIGQFEQDIENAPFTNTERDQIHSQIQQIKGYIEESYELSSEQISKVEDRLDQAEQASQHIGRKDWLILFYGSVFSLILADIITPQTAENVLIFLICGLGHLFGIGGSPAPPLPSAG